MGDFNSRKTALQREGIMQLLLILRNRIAIGTDVRLKLETS
jgi:hypothetical protein